ncbi:MAG: hypothetical protein V4584_03795 [Verrucomicrobiota bacterium]
MNVSTPCPRKRARVLLGLCLMVCIACYLGWRYSAAPFGPRRWSPDHRHYVQDYQTFTLNPFRFMKAGNGADNVDGFIRLYRADGRLLEETHRNGLTKYQIFWSDDAVYTLGDGPVWKLPR